MTEHYGSVIDFWFDELTPEQWFISDDSVDDVIRQRFSALHTSVSGGECWQWREATLGRLAEIVVLDQFSRNLFRGDTKAFAFDAMALVLAQEAVAQQLDQELSVQQRSFIYLPYMHSESLIVHQQALKLFGQEGLEYNYDFELKHLAIIERFGRYPHRNKILGRASTEQELEFLSQPGSSF